MATPLEVRAAVQEFNALIPSMQAPEWHVHSNDELKVRGAARRTEWAKSSGIYAFYSGAGRLRYIGRALSNVGLAARVPDHLKDSCRGRKDWNEVLDDKLATVEVCSLAPPDGVWAASLELFLCERFTDLVNRRRS